MTEQNFNAIITKLNITENTWIRPSFIKEIGLAPEGNLSYNWLTKKLYFDTIDKNIKVKHSKIKLASAELFNVNSIDAKTLKIIPIVPGVIAKDCLNMRIRSITVGDIIYTISSDGTMADATNVSSVDIDAYGAYTIKTIDPIDITGKKVYYSLGSVWDKSYEFNNKIHNRFYDVDYSDYEYDQVIFLQHISAISMR